nr:uncharacterized protein LOC128679479 [Plodia interpunctella]
MLTDSGYTKGKISKETDFMHILLFISFAFHVVVNIGGIFAAPFRMRRLLRCMSTIASIDQSIDAQYSEAKEHKLFVCLAFFIIFFVFIDVFEYFSAVVRFRNPNINWQFLLFDSAINITKFLNMMLTIQFAFVAMSVRVRFTAINRVLNLIAKHLSVPYCLYFLFIPCFMESFYSRTARTSLTWIITQYLARSGSRHELTCGLTSPLSRYVECGS